MTDETTEAKRWDKADWAIAVMFTAGIAFHIIGAVFLAVSGVTWAIVAMPVITAVLLTVLAPTFLPRLPAW